MIRVVAWVLSAFSAGNFLLAVILGSSAQLRGPGLGSAYFCLAMSATAALCSLATSHLEEPS